MKKYFLLLLALNIWSGAFCQKPIDIEKEKEAIIAVINAETQAYFDKNFDDYAATWKHDESVIDIRATKTGYGITVGWERQGSGMKNTMANNPEPEENVEVKKNFSVKVYDDCAWAVFDQDTYNSDGEIVGSALGTNFLEKNNGEWKIVYMTRLNRASYYNDFKGIELTEEDLKKYVGKYELQPEFFLSVFTKGDQLYGQATGQNAFEFLSSGQNKFFAKDFYAQIEFIFENDEVVSLKLTQNGEYEAKKVE